MDDDGYLWYQGRADDVFKVAGYRDRPVGDRELHRQASGGRQRRGGARRPTRRAATSSRRSSCSRRATRRRPALEDDIQQHVRKFLAPYEYPKEIEFIDALPMTTTGKVQRKVLREREAARKAKAR